MPNRLHSSVVILHTTISMSISVCIYMYVCIYMSINAYPSLCFASGPPGYLRRDEGCAQIV